jgi:hypothetical protein
MSNGTRQIKLGIVLWLENEEGDIPPFTDTDLEILDVTVRALLKMLADAEVVKEGDFGFTKEQVQHLIDRMRFLQDVDIQRIQEVG